MRQQVLLRRGPELLLRREWPGLTFLPEPVALAADVRYVVVVQPPVQHGRGDDIVGDAAWARLPDWHTVLIGIAHRCRKFQEGVRKAQTWPL